MNFAKVEHSAPKKITSRLLGKNIPLNDEDQPSGKSVISLDLNRKEISPDLSSDPPQTGDTVREPLLASDHTPLRLQRTNPLARVKQIFVKYAKFIGPGLMVSVSYMDPGNYSTAVAAGSAHQYKLLFSVLLSNILAAFLQILCAKLGAVTGLDLAQNCRRHLPGKLNIVLYILAEVAIIATDLAEVIGTAISLNILLNLPLMLGVIFTIVDVLIVLMAYKPNGDMKIIRLFECFVSLLVFLTVICFGIELTTVDFSFKDVVKGYLPSEDVFVGDALMLSLAILGATVMPHSLFLGSGLVQSRLKDFDIKHGNYKPEFDQDDSDDLETNYKPSLAAIDETMHYTVAELLISLFTVALFVNSAILIVAGSTLQGEEHADLFSIHQLLTEHLSKFAGTIFVLALLFSGQSAGVVCTLAGQMVSEGFLHWTISPTLRRLVTRVVAIAPCIVLVFVAGRSGLSTALNASQVILSLLLPFVSAPLLWFTSSKKIMSVRVDNYCYSDEVDSMELQDLQDGRETGEEVKYKDMSNSKLTNVCAIVIWCFISGLNFFLIWSFAMGKEVAF